MPEKCNSDQLGLPKGVLCDNCERREGAVRTPAAGTGPCQPLSRFSHHLPPTIDFNLLGKLSPYSRECARWQLLLITPYSFTESASPKDGPHWGQGIVRGSITVSRGRALSRWQLTSGPSDQGRKGGFSRSRDSCPGRQTIGRPPRS